MFAILLSERMDPFYQNISSFPTVFFSFFLLLMLFYWLVAILGLVEIDILDFDLPDGEPVASSEAKLTVPDALAGLVLRLGLRGVPFTIVISLIALFGWIISYFTVHFLFGMIPEGLLRYLVSVPTLVIILFIAAIMTGFVIKPLRPFFKKTQAHNAQHILGQIALVRTSKVTQKFGEAVLKDGGADLILKVRVESEENVVKKGDSVVLLEYIKKEHAYIVISENEFKGSNRFTS